MVDTDLAGQVVLLTGGTSGIGQIAARRLAERGATVAVVGRNRDRGEALADEFTDGNATRGEGRITFHQVDLSTQSAVRHLADEVRETYDRLDVLAHNAGLSRSKRIETVDGIELTLAVNHLAPYLLTYELLDRLCESRSSSDPTPRVVVTASDIHRRATFDFDDLQLEREYNGLDAYARSKLATVAFTIELAERLDARCNRNITANCFHPGFVPATGLFRDAAPWVRAGMHVASLVPMVGTTPEEGARRLATLVADPKFEERTGRYVGGDGAVEPDRAATDPEARTRLWDLSADLVAVDPDWP